MVEFLLNNEVVKTEQPAEYLLLDFIRKENHLKGTKSACREGDCGSCSVIVGEYNDHEVNYKAITSCLTPLGNIHGKHVVTIEGVNLEKTTKIQEAIINAAATQCGYCTPGIVLSLTAYFLSQKKLNFEEAIDSIAGNICRCTGYQSIVNAVHDIVQEAGVGKRVNLEWLIENKYIPEYFSDIPDILKGIKIGEDYIGEEIIGGGTEIFVQTSELVPKREIKFIKNDDVYTKIHESDNCISVGSAVTITDFFANEFLRKTIFGLHKAEKLIASVLIRNIATVGGNLVNASPIGDLSVLFLALNASVEIENQKEEIREVALKDFFQSYKKVDLVDKELLKSINIKKSERKYHFNFEKISKRKHLDIATVNSAIQIQVESNTIKDVHLSMGGVAAIPKYLTNTCKELKGKELNPELIKKTAEVLRKEISPISDVRGSAEYKILLARQLFFAHFIELFPERFDIKDLM